MVASGNLWMAHSPRWDKIVNRKW